MTRLWFPPAVPRNGPDCVSSYHRSQHMLLIIITMRLNLSRESQVCCARCMFWKYCSSLALRLVGASNMHACMHAFMHSWTLASCSNSRELPLALAATLGSPFKAWELERTYDEENLNIEVGTLEDGNERTNERAPTHTPTHPPTNPSKCILVQISLRRSLGACATEELFSRSRAISHNSVGLPASSLPIGPMTAW